MLAACRPKAAQMTGLRPTASDNEPATSRVASRASAYTAKTAVRLIAEKRHRSA